jgi:pimeloyl-ACP methyl ester carboxylesterase
MKKDPSSAARKNNPKRAFAIAGGILAAILLIIIGLGPVRAAWLDNYYAKFRVEHQAEHDAVDAQFNQFDVNVNGMAWHYVEQGPKDGPVILFLHGLPEGWSSWKYVIPLINPKYRLIVPDMKGYGRSDKTDNDYNWHTVAAQTVGLMDYLKVDKFYVVGHDWGALIGTILVNDHPQRILGFVRMEADFVPGGTGSQAQTYLKKPQWLLFQFKWIGTWFMQDPGSFIDTVYNGGRMVTTLKKEDRDYFVYEFSRPGVADQLPKYFTLSNWDTQTALTGFCQDKYPFPVLALQADSDPAQPKSIFAGASTQCPNVQLKWVTGASHFDNLDQPAQVAAAINEFLAAAGQTNQ